MSCVNTKCFIHFLKCMPGIFILNYLSSESFIICHTKNHSILIL
jgi:hypothetical protein